MSNKLIGTLPYQTPRNSDLGTLAYQDKDNVTLSNLLVSRDGYASHPDSSVTIYTNQHNFNNGDNALRIEYQGGPTTGDIGAGVVFAQEWWNGTEDLVRTGGIYGWKSFGNGSFGGGLKLYAQPNSGSDMIVGLSVNHDGHVTKPTHPSFCAKLTDNHTITTGVGAVGGTWNTHNNNGNYYDTSTRRFTAPVSGVYGFNCVLGSVGGTGAMAYFSAELRINGVRRLVGAWNGSGSTSYVGASASYVWYMQEGDYAEIGYEVNKNITLQGNATGNCVFSGYLIG